MEIIGIVLFCAVILASAKLMLDQPERKKDPKEDEEQMEYLREWNRNHGKNEKKQSGKVEKSTTTISMLNALVVAFRLRVMMPLKQEDPVQNISKQNGSSARSAELK